MYSGTKLIELLAKQHRSRQSELFKQGSFTLQWRAKVGSFPHPDIETIVSAGEPCGAWQPSYGRPEAKRNVGENLQQLPTLPLNGYIPGSAIRGIVRAWAKKRSHIKPRMYELLGYQEQDTINAGKIEFLDAWSEKPSKLTLDIVNPQQNFQVYHQGQSTPLSFYTLGDGKNPVEITVAIRGIAGRSTPAEVNEVWEWVQQALGSYGIGSRTASGYGAFKPPRDFRPSADLGASDPGYKSKQFEFSLYSQGSAGVDPRTMELRPAHWRGWLRSWVLRFLLGVMSQQDAEKTIGELVGTLEPESRKGCVRLQMTKGRTWSERSENQPYFYAWQGKLKVSAPSEVLTKIILPIMKFAVMVGGVGRGWRRPLHIFQMPHGHAAARGTHLFLTHQVPNSSSGENETKPFGLKPTAQDWQQLYQNWQQAVENQWGTRFRLNSNLNLKAEVFSTNNCAVYILPAPEQEPINRQDLEWEITNSVDTRGSGMGLIYDPKYKRKNDVGGSAAGGGHAYCSWVSIKRVKIPNQQEQTDCQEILCLFMGDRNDLRSRFLRDLANMSGAVSLFGIKPNS